MRSASPLRSEPQRPLIDHPDSTDALSLECSVRKHLPHAPRTYLESFGGLFDPSQGHEQKYTEVRIVLY